MRVVILLLLISSSLFAQDTQKEINEQVWKPFIKGLSGGDAELFMSVHSKDLVRSGRDSKKVLNWDDYYTNTKASNEWGRENKVRLEIELHFTERISNANQAIDVGIYKTTSFAADGKQHSGYGRFHVVHRKENGTWKILVDTDSNEGNTIGESQFLAAKPME
jgi:ketosteroid isomerase-like protein